MALTNQQAADICGQIGHQPAGLRSLTEHKHRFECGCGYVSTNRRTLRLAVEAGIHHMHKVAQEAIANGAVSPKETPSDTVPRSRVPV